MVGRATPAVAGGRVAGDLLAPPMRPLRPPTRPRRPPTPTRSVGHLGPGAIVLVLLGCAAQPPGTGERPARGVPVNYYVRVASPAAGAFDVTLAADDVRADSIDFVLPAWVPGRYGLGAGRTVIENFAARDDEGRPIASRRSGLTSWRLYPDRARYVTVSYRVVPGPVTVPLPFRTRLGIHGGYALGGALLGTFVGLEGRAVTVSLDLPSGWRAVAPLRPAGPNRFSAASYAELPGTPFSVGDRMRDYKLFVQGRPHEVLVQGGGSGFVPDSLLGLVDEAIEYGTRFYGPPPYERYVFAIHFVPPEEAGLGATGQRAGSAYFLPALDARRLREAGIGRLFLHQYLHAWYPGAFGPAELVRPRFWAAPQIDDLWFIEGSAEYYAQLLPVRYGPAGRDAFYRAMEDLLTFWRELGGGERIDPRALSRLARRGDDEQATTRMLVGGTLAAFLVDLGIREETQGLRGLDQAIRYLQRWAPPGGYSGDEMWREVAGALGVPAEVLGPLVSDETVSIDAGLSRAGLRASERTERRRALGARLLAGPEGRFVVADVEPGGTAASAGLRDGDRLLKIGPTPVGPDEIVATRFALASYVREARPGAAVQFEVERDGVVRTLRGEVRETRLRRVVLVEDPAATSAAVLVRSSLFRSAGEPGD